jgi:hypothetical protein
MKKRLKRIEKKLDQIMEFFGIYEMEIVFEPSEELQHATAYLHDPNKEVREEILNELNDRGFS